MQKNLTVADVAIRLRCSKRQIIRLIDAGRLAAIDVAIGNRRKLVVSIEEVQRFEQESQTATKPKVRPKPKGIPQYVSAATIERERQRLEAASRR